MDAVMPLFGARSLDRVVIRRLGLLAAVAAATVVVATLRPGLGGPLTYVVVAGDSMLPTLHGGDVVFIWRQTDYALGDVIAYRVPEGEPGAGVLVIHRVAGGSPAPGYVAKGDNKRGIDPWRPGPRDVVGKARWRIPRLGMAIVFLRSPLGFALVAGLVTFAIALGGEERERKRARPKASYAVPVARLLALLAVGLVAAAAGPLLGLL